MIYERPQVQLCAVSLSGNRNGSQLSPQPIGMGFQTGQIQELWQSNDKRIFQSRDDVSTSVGVSRPAREKGRLVEGTKGESLKVHAGQDASEALGTSRRLETRLTKSKTGSARAGGSKGHRFDLRSTQPRARHSTPSRPSLKQGNGPSLTEWLVSPGVRSIYSTDGAVLLDIKNGQCYGLNRVASYVWVTIEESPSGIALTAIVGGLESHFTYTLEQLQRVARNCLDELQSASLIEKKATAGKDPYATSLSFLSARHHGRQLPREADRITSEKSSYVRRLETLELFIDELFPQGIESSVDWRAKKLKTFIDNAEGNLNENLGHICSQLELSLSDRQARRLFKQATRISMKDYVRERRLIFAAKQLQTTDQPIKAIATNAGYDSYDGFCRAFQAMFQLRPVEFRSFWQRHQVSV